MVVETCAAQRSELAKGLGLGQIRRNQAETWKAEGETQAAVSAPVRRGRPKKASAAAE